MATDDFTKPTSTGVSPDSFPINPNDSANLPRPVRSIRANVGGQIHVITLNDSNRVLQFADGETRFVGVKKVFLDGTTATGLEGMP